MSIPKPVLPKLDVEEEVYAQQQNQGEESEETEVKDEILHDKLSNAFSKIIGFISCIGLPPDVAKEKAREYSVLADELGVSDAVVEVMEYYMPLDTMNPLTMLFITVVIYAVAVVSDRMALQEKLKQQKEMEAKIKNKKMEADNRVSRAGNVEVQIAS